MPKYYIQRIEGTKRSTLETVDEFSTRKEAATMVREYSYGDTSAHYYISTRPCKAWRDRG